MSRPDRYTDALGAAFRQQYERGASCQDLADTNDLSYTTMRTWLLRAGTTMRPPSRTARVAVEPRPRPKQTTGFSVANVKRVTYISTCGACRLGVYEQQERVWSSFGLHLGWMHASCA